MVPTTAPRTPGRPKNEGKRVAIIEAARRLFLGHAYEFVTMEQVANAASVAKMTVYGHFHDKESLFEAMVRSTADALIAALPALPRGDGDLEEELAAFGRTFLGVLLSPEMVSSLHRHFDMLARHPRLAQRIYNAGPGRTRAMLAAYLASAAGSVDLPPDHAIEAASDLMSLWLGDMQQRLALGLAAPITPDEIAQRARRCTRLFLRAYGLRPRGNEGAGRSDGAGRRSGEDPCCDPRP